MIDVAIEWGLAQQVFDFCRRNLLIVRALLNLALEGNLAEGFVDLLLQLTDTTFARIALDHHLDGCLVESGFQLRHVQTCIFKLARYQVTFGYLNLFLCDIAAYLDDFHTVE